MGRVISIRAFVRQSPSHIRMLFAFACFSASTRLFGFRASGHQKRTPSGGVGFRLFWKKEACQVIFCAVWHAEGARRALCATICHIFLFTVYYFGINKERLLRIRAKPRVFRPRRPLFSKTRRRCRDPRGRRAALAPSSRNRDAALPNCGMHKNTARARERRITTTRTASTPPRTGVPFRPRRIRLYRARRSRSRASGRKARTSGTRDGGRCRTGE